MDFWARPSKKNGMQEEALACYEKMLKIDPSDATAKWRRGLMMSATGRTKDDRYYWKELTSKPGSEIAGRIQNIIKTSIMNADEQGLSGYDIIIMTPGLIQMMGVLITGSEKGLLEPFVCMLEAGGQSSNLGMFDVAKYAEEFMPTNASDRDPDLADDLLEKANNLADGGMFAEAAEAAGEAVAADPGFADAHSARATFLAKTGRYKEALESTDKVLGLRPDSPDSHGAKGMLLERVGRTAEAAACYDQVSKMAPGDMIARYLKCGLLASVGDARGLAECYRAALEAKPDGKKSADMQDDMRVEYRELMRRAKAAGSLEAGFAKFMKKTGVGIEPIWGRAGGSRQVFGGRRVRAGRRR